MRPSSWLAALSVALCLTGSAGLASVAFRFELPASAIGWLLVAGGGIGLAIGEGAGFVTWWRGESIEHQLNQARRWALDLDNQRKELAMAGQAPVAAPVIVTRQVARNTAAGPAVIEMQEKRPARWVAWQAFAITYLDWVRLRGGATSGVLVGPEGMFAERGQWVDGTNGLRDAKMIEKVNGRTTEIANVDALLARLQEGKFDWPADRDPPAHRPCPIELRAPTAAEA